MKSLFQYSLLQFRYSQALGEILNVGVLVLFPTQKQIFFLYPKHLVRLKQAYRQAPERTLRAYFKTFEKRVDKLNKQPELFADYERNPAEFIDREFLSSDSSALQFAPIRTSFAYTENIASILGNIKKQYLSAYDPIEDHNRVDDADLKSQYRAMVRGLLRSTDAPKKIFQEGFDITVPTPGISTAYKKDLKATHHFDFGWQNHSLHLVKPVSFDLKKGASIEEKAYTNLGQFLSLGEYAKSNNVTFDLIVAPPSDSALLDNYEYALSIIKQPKSVNIVKSDQLDEYANRTVQALLEE